jgi:hypothetical protein
MKRQLLCMTLLVLAACNNQPADLGADCEITVTQPGFTVVLPCGYQESSQLAANPLATYNRTFIATSPEFTLVTIQIFPQSVIVTDPNSVDTGSITSLYPDAQLTEQPDVTTPSGGKVQWGIATLQGVRMVLAVATLPSGDVLALTITNDASSTGAAAQAVLDGIDVQPASSGG